jgi:NADH-quinone oxidoreductase subunit A
VFDSALPILLFVLVATLLPIGMILGPKILAPSRQTAVKAMPYESGMDPIHDTRRRFDVRFHLLAIDFLVFDVELLFLYPWAVARGNPSAGVDKAVAANLVDGRTIVFVGAMVFIALLLAGFVYTWRKGVFEWR